MGHVAHNQRASIQEKTCSARAVNQVAHFAHPIRDQAFQRHSFRSPDTKNMSPGLETIDPAISNLLEATSSLVSSLELSDVLSKILRLAELFLAADAYAVWGCKPDDTTWRVIYSAGLS